MRDFGKMFRLENFTQARRDDHERGALDKHVVLQLRPTVWADMANALWTIQNKTSDPVTGEKRDEFRPIIRHIDRLAECLQEIGVEIQTHTNQTFDSGQSLEVIAFQPTAGITRETVIETIRPTVYLQGHRLQIGQVIVATPETHTGEKNQ